MNTRLRRIWLFLRIVGREWHGGRLGIAMAWSVAKIVCPHQHEEDQRYNYPNCDDQNGA